MSLDYSLIEIDDQEKVLDDKKYFMDCFGNRYNAEEIDFITNSEKLREHYLSVQQVLQDFFPVEHDDATIFRYLQMKIKDPEKYRLLFSKWHQDFKPLYPVYICYQVGFIMFNFSKLYIEFLDKRHVIITQGFGLKFETIDLKLHDDLPENLKEIIRTFLDFIK